MEWMEDLPDELKAEKSLSTFDSTASLAKAYIDTKAMVGSSIRIPSENATSEQKAETYQKVMNHMPELMLRPNPESQEQMDEYYRMLGVPESADDYTFEGESLSPEVVNQLRSLAKETNMTKAQWAKYSKMMSEASESTQHMKEDSRVRMGAELKNEWGLAFEDRYAVVEKFLEERPDLGSAENYSPGAMKELYDIAQSTLQSPQGHRQESHVTSRNTPSEALAQIKEIENNPLTYSFDPKDRPEQQRLLEKKIELMKHAYPDKYS